MYVSDLRFDIVALWKWIIYIKWSVHTNHKHRHRHIFPLPLMVCSRADKFRFYAPHEMSAFTTTQGRWLLGFSLFVVLTASAASYLSRNSVPITLDNPQTSLSTVFSQTTFCWKMKCPQWGLCQHITAEFIECKFLIRHESSFFTSEKVVWQKYLNSRSTS